MKELKWKHDHAKKEEVGRKAVEVVTKKIRLKLFVTATQRVRDVALAHARVPHVHGTGPHALDHAAIGSVSLVVSTSRGIK